MFVKLFGVVLAGTSAAVAGSFVRFLKMEDYKNDKALKQKPTSGEDISNGYVREVFDQMGFAKKKIKFYSYDLEKGRNFGAPLITESNFVSKELAVFKSTPGNFLLMPAASQKKLWRALAGREAAHIKSQPVFSEFFSLGATYFTLMTLIRKFRPAKIFALANTADYLLAFIAADITSRNVAKKLDLRADLTSAKELGTHQELIKYYESLPKEEVPHNFFLKFSDKFLTSKPNTEARIQALKIDEKKVNTRYDF